MNPLMYSPNVFFSAVPPKDVYIRLHTLAVREGGSALLECSCKADPPVEVYDWSYTQHSRTRFSPQHAHIIRIDNVTRHTRVICTAKNRLGWTPSPATGINVECEQVYSMCCVKFKMGERSFDLLC